MPGKVEKAGMEPMSTATVGVPPNARKALSCASIRVSTRSSVTNSTSVARLQPSVATNTDRRLLPRRITAQSTGICSPAPVSNRTAGSAGAGGRSDATKLFRSV
jgi:hypothetical protein